MARERNTADLFATEHRRSAIGDRASHRADAGSRLLRGARRASLVLGAVAVVFALGGCTDEATETPAASREARVTVVPLPPATETPLPMPTVPPPIDTPAPPELVPGSPGAAAGADVSEPATAGAGTGSGVGAPPSSIGGTVPAGACRVIRDTEEIILMPIWDAPTPVHEAWAQYALPWVVAEVTEHNTEHRFHRLKAVEGPEGVPLDYDFVVSYERSPLPLEIGRTYRFTTQRDLPGAVPVGRGLRVEDDAGMVFLYVAARETEQAHERILGGDRGGLAVRQVGSPCAEMIIDECGYELRSAPAEFTLGSATLSLMGGITGTLQSEPPYQVDLMTSHLRRWVGDLPCPDPTDWVLSYRLERE